MKDFLFISEKTGIKINSNSLGNDFNKLTKELKLENKICAHMFRHRFITNIFINLIKQYDIENKEGLNYDLGMKVNEGYPNKRKTAFYNAMEKHFNDFN